MDTVLLILGVLGTGAVIISAYVFLVAARDYVSARDYLSEDNAKNKTTMSTQQALVERSNRDRRVKKLFDFPMTINGMLVPMERRVTQERRYALA